jgi:hypothetical protein
MAVFFSRVKIVRMLDLSWSVVSGFDFLDATSASSLHGQDASKSVRGNDREAGVIAQPINGEVSELLIITCGPPFHLETHIEQG